jgi:hypothetical protein
MHLRGRRQQRQSRSPIDCAIHLMHRLKGLDPQVKIGCARINHLLADELAPLLAARRNRRNAQDVAREKPSLVVAHDEAWVRSVVLAVNVDEPQLRINTGNVPTHVHKPSSVVFFELASDWPVNKHLQSVVITMKWAELHAPGL